MNLRWGIDGPTVEFEKHGLGWYADINGLDVTVSPVSRIEGACSYDAQAENGELDTAARGGCQQTALDRLHARLREVAAEITAAL